MAGFLGLIASLAGLLTGAVQGLGLRVLRRFAD
jgi:hypothetical protein